MHDGNYFFLSNNCAVEELKLLRGGTNNSKLVGLDNIMPNGLLEVLKGRGLADTSVLDDPRGSPAPGLSLRLFPRSLSSDVRGIEKAPADQTGQAVEDWLSLTAAERRQWFDQADLRTSAALLLLEQASLSPAVAAGSRTRSNSAIWVPGS